MKIDLNELRKRNNYISCREHPDYPLLIWNYNTDCQWEKAWDGYTTMARGLITDLKGNVVSMPFPKFFNLGEHLQLHELPAEIPEIREKVDSWLGVGFMYDNLPHVSSRGSFDSIGAKWATQWIQERYSAKDFKEGYTYVFEIVCPLTRIIIDYGDREELVLLAVIHTEDRSELDIDEEGARLGLAVPKKINQDIGSLNKDMGTLPVSQEGYVLRYSDGFRVKMKGHEYTRMANALIHCSTTAVWEWLQAGGSISGFNEYLPAELWEWVETKARAIQAAYELLVVDVETAYITVKDLDTRKEQAACLMVDYKEIAWMVFIKLDNKELTGKSFRNSWLMVKPEFEKPTLREGQNGQHTRTTTKT